MKDSVSTDFIKAYHFVRSNKMIESWIRQGTESKYGEFSKRIGDFLFEDRDKYYKSMNRKFANNLSGSRIDIISRLVLGGFVCCDPDLEDQCSNKTCPKGKPPTFLLTKNGEVLKEFKIKVTTYKFSSENYVVDKIFGPWELDIKQFDRSNEGKKYKIDYNSQKGLNIYNSQIKHIEFDLLLENKKENKKINGPFKFNLSFNPGDYS